MTAVTVGLVVVPFFKGVVVAALVPFCLLLAVCEDWPAAAKADGCGFFLGSEKPPPMPLPPMIMVELPPMLVKPVPVAAAADGAFPA